MAFPVPGGERQTMTVREFCATTGLAAPTVYASIREGTFPLPVIQIGRRIVISRPAFEQMLSGSGSPLTPNRELSAEVQR